MSAFELAKAFTKPVSSKPAELCVPVDVIAACEQLQARRKLALTVRSKALNKVPIAIGDSVQIFQMNEKEKREKLSKSKTVLSVNLPVRSVTVHDANGRSFTVAAEDTWPYMSLLFFA